MQNFKKKLRKIVIGKQTIYVCRNCGCIVSPKDIFCKGCEEQLQEDPKLIKKKEKQK